jgi:O-antigen ligase
VVFGLGCAGLLVTFSRSAWLGLAGGLALLAGSLLVGRRKNDFLALAGLGAGAAVVLLPFLLAQAPLMASRLNLNRSFELPTPEKQAIGERGLLNATAMQIFARQTVTGVGVGAYPLAMARQLPDYPFDYQPPHIVLLDVAVETGMMGAASYVVISLSPWALLFFQRKRWAHQRLAFSLPLWAATAAFLAISLISLLDYYPWMLNPGRVWQWLIWGVWAGEYNRACGKENHG